MKIWLTLLLCLVLCFPLYAGERQGSSRDSNTGQLPYIPRPRNPVIKMYQPYYGYEIDRRMQEERQGREYEKGYKGHRPHSGRDRRPQTVTARAQQHSATTI
jgi:hypothetical protein